VRDTKFFNWENKEMKNLTVSFSRSGDERNIRTVTLTEKEFKALETIKQNSDAPDRPSECTFAWTQPSDLIRNGYSKHEAAGLWSSLMEKLIIELYEPRSKEEGGDLFTFDYNII
jgi:hypothetical protein